MPHASYENAIVKALGSSQLSCFYGKQQLLITMLIVLVLSHSDNWSVLATSGVVVIITSVSRLLCKHAWNRQVITVEITHILSY